MTDLHTCIVRTPIEAFYARWNRGGVGCRRNLYADTPWVATYDGLFAKNQQDGVFWGLTRPLFVTAIVFRSLASALEFKLLHESSEFSIEIVRGRS